jgi:hypothetical protein
MLRQPYRPSNPRTTEMCDIYGMENEPIELEPEPRKRLAQLVGEAVARQENERAEDAAYADLPENFDPANPGGTFAKRVTQRIAQQRL